MRAEFLWGSVKGKQVFEDLGIGVMIFQFIFEKWNRRVWSELIHFRIWTKDRLLLTQ